MKNIRVYILLITQLLIVFIVNAIPSLPLVSREMVVVSVHDGIGCEGDVFNLMPVTIDKRCFSFPSVNNGEMYTSMLMSCDGYRQMFANQSNCYGSTTEPTYIGETCFDYPNTSPPYSVKFSCNEVLQPIRIVLYFDTSVCTGPKTFELYLTQNQCKYLSNFDNGYTEFGGFAVKVSLNTETYRLDVFFYSSTDCEQEPFFVFDYPLILDGRCTAPGGLGIKNKNVINWGFNRTNGHSHNRLLQDPFQLMIQLFDGASDEAGSSFSSLTSCNEVTSAPTPPCVASGSNMKNGPDMIVYLIYVLLVILVIL